MATYDPTAANSFLRTQRRGVNTQYGIGLAELNRRRTEINRVTGRQRADLQFGQRQEREQLPGEFVGRGLYRSGILKRQAGLLGREQLGQLGDLGQGRQAQLNALGAQRAQLEAERTSALGALDFQLASSRGNLATSMLGDSFRIPMMPQLLGFNMET